MYQPTFADLEYEGKKLKTRREKFLERMDGLIPCVAEERRVFGLGTVGRARPAVLSQGWPRSAAL